MRSSIRRPAVTCRAQEVKQGRRPEDMKSMVAERRQEEGMKIPGPVLVFALVAVAMLRVVEVFALVVMPPAVVESALSVVGLMLRPVVEMMPRAVELILPLEMVMGMMPRAVELMLPMEMVMGMMLWAVVVFAP